MPRERSGQKRPGDVIGAGIKVAKIAIQELQDESNAGKEYASEGGKKGGASRFTLGRYVAFRFVFLR